LIHRRATLVAVERIAAAATALLGWIVVGDQFASDGLTHGSGTFWLGAFAAAGTAGVVVLFRARPDSHWIRAAGLALTAFSPTVFAYVLNIALLIIGLVEVALAVASRRRTGLTPTL
jgi:hypothetical protein